MFRVTVSIRPGGRCSCFPLVSIIASKLEAIRSAKLDPTLTSSRNNSNCRETMNFSPSRLSVSSGACGGYCEDCGQTWDYPTCRQSRLPNYAYPRSGRLSVDNASLGTFYPPPVNHASPGQLGYFVPFYENTHGGMANYYESPLVRKR